MTRTPCQGLRLLVPALALALALSAAGCGSAPKPAAPASAPSQPSQEPARAADAKPEAGGPYRLGVVLPLSGPAAAVGKYTQQGIEAALKQVNGNGGVHGRQLQVKIEDDKTDPSVSVVAVKKLHQEGIDLLIGPELTNMALAVIPTVEELQIPQISIGAGIQIVVPLKKWVFKLPHTDTLIADKQLGFLARKGVKKLAILHQDDASGVSGKEQLEKLAGKHGVEIVAVEKFNGAATNMVPQLTKIAASPAEAVAIFGVAGPTGIIAKNARDMGFQKPIIGSHGGASQQFITVAGPAAEGFYFVGQKSTIGKNLPASDPVKKHYDIAMKEISGPFDTFIGNGYDSIMLAAAALEKAGPKPDKHAIRNALEAINGVTLLNATYKFSPDNHDGPQADSLVVLQVRNQEFVSAE